MKLKFILTLILISFSITGELKFIRSMTLGVKFHNIKESVTQLTEFTLHYNLDTNKGTQMQFCFNPNEEVETFRTKHEITFQKVLVEGEQQTNEFCILVYSNLCSNFLDVCYFFVELDAFYIMFDGPVLVQQESKNMNKELNTLLSLNFNLRNHFINARLPFMDRYVILDAKNYNLTGMKQLYFSLIVSLDPIMLAKKIKNVKKLQDKIETLFSENNYSYINVRDIIEGDSELAYQGEDNIDKNNLLTKIQGCLLDSLMERPNLVRIIQKVVNGWLRYKKLLNNHLLGGCFRSLYAFWVYKTICKGDIGDYYTISNLLSVIDNKNEQEVLDGGIGDNVVEKINITLRKPGLTNTIMKEIVLAEKFLLNSYRYKNAINLYIKNSLVEPLRKLGNFY
jgi:hypothetical protein